MTEIESTSYHGLWKGDKAGYVAIHEWIRNHFPIPKTCQDCGCEKRLDLANISKEYKRDISDWIWLCRRCHMIMDGTLENFKKNVGRGRVN